MLALQKHKLFNKKLICARKKNKMKFMIILRICKNILNVRYLQ